MRAWAWSSSQPRRRRRGRGERKVYLEEVSSGAKPIEGVGLLSQRSWVALSAEQVALIPQCAECYRVWLPDDADRWQDYFDTDDELVFFCPECAEREFER